MANSNLPRRIIKETQRLLSEPEWGPIEYYIMAKHFKRQGKWPYAYHAVRTAPAPRNVASNVKDQIIRSRKGWLKRKAAEASTSNAGASTSAQAQGPLTQTSKNPAARGASKN